MIFKLLRTYLKKLPKYCKYNMEKKCTFAKVKTEVYEMSKEKAWGCKTDSCNNDFYTFFHKRELVYSEIIAKKLQLFLSF